MGSPEELDGRVTALEAQMRDVRQEAREAKVLAQGAGRDVSALAVRADADRKLLTALRETQVEHGQRLGRLEVEVREGFAAVRQGFVAVGLEFVTLREEMSELRAEIRQDVSELRAEIRGDMSELRAEVRRDGSELRAEIGGDMSELRAEIRQDVSELRQETSARFANLEAGHAMILDLLRRRNGHDDGPSASAE